MKVSASFLSMEENIKENLYRLIEAKPNYLHLDIMDGNFVPKKTWDIDEIKEILPDTDIPFDIHLMVTDVERYVRDFSSLKPNYITFHIETACNPEKMISLIHSYGCKAGITLNPDTALDRIVPYLSMIDLVLIMSVEAGAGGQSFLPSSVQKIDTLYQMRLQYQYHYEIEVDGGINQTTAPLCHRADTLVAGSFITSKEDYQLPIEILQKIK